MFVCLEGDIWCEMTRFGDLVHFRQGDEKSTS